jgi:very-short-patch-repair endonuclease
MTVTERRLWSQLRGRQLDGWKFRRQAPIGSYFVDFVCLAAKLVVELDGSTHNELKDDYDVRRQRWLESQGYKVLRFSADYDDMDYLEGVVETIYLELEAVACSTSPSRAQRRGLDLMRASPPSGEGLLPRLKPVRLTRPRFGRQRRWGGR